MRSMPLSQIIAAATLCGALAAPAMANLVTNAGFEAGDAGWTAGQFGWTSHNFGRGVHSGNNSMSTGCTDSAFTCTFGQTLSTVAGQRYDISFWLYTDGVVDANGQVTAQFDNGLRVWFDGAIVDTILNFPTTNTSSLFDPGGPYTLITISGAMASSTSSLLQFGGYHGPAGIYVDDVSVDASLAVPEPGSMALACLALLGMGASRRRKR